MAVSIAFLGGRTAMISAATGAIALVIAPVYQEHGLEYLLATVILGGLIQVLLGLLGLARLMRFIPRMVMIGFVNALAILIFMSQLPYLIDVPVMVYVLVVVGIAIIVLLPRLTTAIPPPLVSITAVTAFVAIAGLTLPTIGDEAELPDSLPTLLVPDVPLTMETLQMIGPLAVAMALVGLMESLMTAKLVDDITDTHSDKVRESWGQGVANIITGFFGGMGGCAMIGQTMINVKVSRARTRISTFLAGIFVLALVVGLGDLVAIIPMAALVAVMVIVAVSTFDWHSIQPATLRRMPLGEMLVMITTVVVTIWTHNLAIGVGCGVLAAMILFARRVAHFTQVVDVAHPDEDTRVYAVIGELFFASSNALYYQFDYVGDPQNVIIDMSQSHVWDASTVAALDAIVRKYHAKGKNVEIVGLNEDGLRRHGRLAGHLKAGEDH